jgi:hypothetical protein
MQPRSRSAENSSTRCFNALEPVLSGLRHCGDVDRGYVVLTAAPVVLVRASEDVLPLNALY